MDPAGALRELQERDLDLARLTKQLDEMPEKRAILQIRAKIAEIRGLKARTEAVVHALDAAIKRHEDEVQAVADKIDDEQAKLLSGRIKSPKELQSISVELNSLKRRMDQLETEMLAQMQKRETAVGQAAKVDDAQPQRCRSPKGNDVRYGGVGIRHGQLNRFRLEAFRRREHRGGCILEASNPEEPVVISVDRKPPRRHRVVPLLPKRDGDPRAGNRSLVTGGDDPHRDLAPRYGRVELGASLGRDVGDPDGSIQ